MARGQTCIQQPLPNNRSPTPSCSPAQSPSSFFVLDRNARVLTTSGGGVPGHLNSSAMANSASAGPSHINKASSAAGRSSRGSFSNLKSDKNRVGLSASSSDRSEINSRSDEAATRMSMDPTSRRPTQHRRGSSQSLKLDLDGLDLGTRPTASSRKPIKPDSTVSSPRLLSSSAQGSQSVASPLDSGDTVKAEGREQMQQERLREKFTSPVDSFFAHLQHCEDSNDILPAENVLASTTNNTIGIGAEERKSLTLSRATEGHGGPEQVLGGFASLGYGYDRSASTRASGGLVSTPHSPANALATTIAAKARGGSVAMPWMNEDEAEERSPWSMLSVLSHDPLETLDLLSIDEMGLHSIDVGSAEDWEGSRLSSCSSCSADSDGTMSSIGWTVARSVRRHRKWVIAPSSALLENSFDNGEEVARAVVVSDHLASKVASKDDQPPTTFSGMASFELRFLQAGSAAPNCTIILANAHTQREIAAVASESSASGTESGHSPVSTAPGFSTGGSRGVGEETSSQGQADVGWPSLRASAAYRESPAASTKGIRRPASLEFSKSISNAAQTEPFVTVESRRPSLGKSVSHESLGVTTPKLPPSTSDDAESNNTRSKRLSSVPTFSAPGAAPSHSASSSPTVAPVYEHSPDFHIPLLPSEGSSPFGDYSLGLGVGDQRGRAGNISRMAALTGDSLGPSPRSSMTEVRGIGSPVLSTIDPSRIAAYQRLARGGSPLRDSRMTTPQRTQTHQGTTTLSSRRDNNKRISEWFRKKVMPNHGNFSPVPWDSLPFSPTVKSPDGSGSGARASAPVAMQGLSPSTSLPAPKSAPKGKNSFSSSKSGSNRPSFNPPATARAGQFAFSPPPSSSFVAESIQSRREIGKTNSTAIIQSRPDTAPETLDYDSPRVSIVTPPKPSVEASQRAAVWAHLRGDRRRSSSDDNIAAFTDSARRREREEAHVRDRSFALSSSMPRQHLPLSPPLSTHNCFPSASLNSDSSHYNKASTTTNPGLIGIDSVPSDAITMIIPLPLASASASATSPKTERYLRVAFVPFRAADMPSAEQGHEHRHVRQHSRTSQQESQQQQFQRSPALMRESLEQHQHTRFEPSSSPPVASEMASPSHNWYRKLAHAWIASTGHSSSIAHPSPGSSPNTLEDDMALSTPRRGSRNQHDRCRLPTRQKHATVQPFRITAQVFAAASASTAAAPEISSSSSSSSLATQPFRISAADSNSSSLIPAPMSFPVVLGICDSSRNLDLVPEGWASIGLPQGPASLLTPSPSSSPSTPSSLLGVADLIVAGSAACMDL